MADAEAWIDLVIRRSAELRRAGILSIGCDGNSVVLAPAEPDASDSDHEDDPAAAPEAEESDAWNKPESYPSGSVPTYGEVEDLPAIPQFSDD